MKTFSTLDELFAAADGHQITGQELINSRTRVFGEWQDKVGLSPLFVTKQEKQFLKQK